MTICVIILLDILAIKVESNMVLSTCAILGTCAYIRSIPDILKFDKFKQAVCIVSLLSLLLTVSVMQPQYFSTESKKVDDEFSNHPVVTEYYSLFVDIKEFLPKSFKQYVIANSDLQRDCLNVIINNEDIDYNSIVSLRNDMISYKEEFESFRSSVLWILTVFVVSSIILLSLSERKSIKRSLIKNKGGKIYEAY